MRGRIPALNIRCAYFKDLSDTHIRTGLFRSPYNVIIPANVIDLLTVLSIEARIVTI